MSRGFHVGKVKVSMKLLHALLRLPEGCSIEGIEQGYQLLKDGCFAVYVVGPAVPINSDENNYVSTSPTLKLIYKQENGKTVFDRFEATCQ